MIDIGADLFSKNFWISTKGAEKRLLYPTITLPCVSAITDDISASSSGFTHNGFSTKTGFPCFKEEST